MGRGNWGGLGWRRQRGAEHGQGGNEKREMGRV